MNRLLHLCCLFCVQVGKKFENGCCHVVHPFLTFTTPLHHKIMELQIYLHLSRGHISGHQYRSCGEAVVPRMGVRRRHLLPSAREASADHVAESAPEVNVHCRVEHEIQTEVDCLKKKRKQCIKISSFQSKNYCEVWLVYRRLLPDQKDELIFTLLNSLTWGLLAVSYFVRCQSFHEESKYFIGDQ